MGWGAIISQMDSGPRWRKHRRIIQEKFSPRYFGSYAGMQKRVVYTFLADLGRTPEKFGDNIKRYAIPYLVDRIGSYTAHIDSVRGFSFVPPVMIESFLHPAASIILEITYGYTVESVDDYFIYLADEAAIESLRYGSPGATLCDILPIREEIFHISISYRAPLNHTRK
jgi:hypothetical protein